MQNTDPEWLRYVSAISNVATPILILGLTAIGWRLRSRIDRRFEKEDQRRDRGLDLEDKRQARQTEQEDKLRDDRISAYNKILEPFIIMLMTDEAWASDPKNKNKDRHKLGLQMMLSLDYRKQGFRLSLVASDGVTRAYNNMMQHVFSTNLPAESEGTPRAAPANLIALLGAFLLEIRRSMGNESTDLDRWEMLEWFISDARALSGG